MIYCCSHERESDDRFSFYCMICLVQSVLRRARARVYLFVCQDIRKCYTTPFIGRTILVAGALSLPVV